MRRAALAVAALAALVAAAAAFSAAGRAQKVIYVRFGPENKVYTPAYFNAVDGDIVRVCNRTPLIARLFSLSDYNHIGSLRGNKEDPSSFVRAPASRSHSTTRRRGRSGCPSATPFTRWHS